MRRLLLALPVAAIALLSAAPSRVEAQVVPAGARAAGMGQNYGTVARGFSAGYWNPANLGQSNNPRFSLELPGFALSASADPLKLSEIKEWGGDTLTDAIKQKWLNQIGENGSLEIRGGANVTEFGLSIGPLAVTAGTVVGARGDLPHDAVAAILYGNAGPSGTGDTLSFNNAAFQAFAVSQVGVSYGHTIPLHITHAANERFSVGVTAKYVLGHGLVDARNGQGLLTPDSASVRFTTIALADSSSPTNGTGTGIDVGAAWTTGKLSAGFTIYDLVNTFRFNDNGRVGEMHAFISPDSNSSDSGDMPIDSASATLQQAAKDLANNERFMPSFRLALGYQLNNRIQLAGDILRQSNDDNALVTAKGTTIGLGAEIRYIPFLPIRGGIRVGDGATSFSAGTGINIGPFHLDGAIGRRSSAGYNAALGLTFGAQ